jgi:hypothetical protein
MAVAKQNYKIDANQIQVIDRANNYTGTDVETILAEIYLKLGTGGGVGNIKMYSSVASEYPSSGNTFFQDDGIFVVRSIPEESNVDYNGNGGIISFTGNNSVNKKTINCSIKNNFYYGSVKSSVMLGNNTNILRLILNKSQGSYYEAEISNAGIKMSYYNNNVRTVIYQNLTLIPTNQYREYLFFKTGEYLYLYVNGNLAFPPQLHSSIDRAGEIQISYEIKENTSGQMDCKYMEFGVIPQPLL